MLLHVGRIDKPHGLRGEVVVTLTTNREERLSTGAELVVANGDTLVVESAVPLGHRWIVRFAGIDSRNAAEAISHQDLQAAPLDDPDALWVHELVGNRVFDQDGVDRGVVVAVIANPASDLLSLDSGALVPLRFVVERTADRLVVDTPPGLFE